MSGENMKMADLVRSTGEDQQQMIIDIMKLYLPSGRFDVDPTYSKGGFYRDGRVPQPVRRFDLSPQDELTEQSCASSLPLEDGSAGSIIFDPPFLAGATAGSGKGKPGEMEKRFTLFPSMWELYRWYDACLLEFHRVLEDGGLLVFKCQDTVYDHRQFLSHVRIINAAERIGFYAKDMFILLARSRLVNQKTQEHSRKFHCYFLVFQKRYETTRHDARFLGDARFHSDQPHSFHKNWDLSGGRKRR